MRKWVIGIFLSLAMNMCAVSQNVTIEGRPFLENTLMPSIDYSGGGMQLMVKVKVLDANGKPTNGVRVRISAQSGASLARLRGYGITVAGIGTVTAAWDIPIVSLARVAITACTDEPSPDCSKTEVFDLRRRWDLEAENSYSESVGNQVYSSPSAPGGTSDVLSNGYQYQGLARLVLNLHSGGTLAHANQWSAFAEGGGYYLQSTSFVGGAVSLPNGYGPYYVLQSFESNGAHPVAAFGVQGMVWGRLFTGVSLSPPLNSEPGNLHAQAVWEQSLSPQVAPIGGVSIDRPEFGENGNVYGTAWGPIFGFAYFPRRSAAMSFTALGDWASVGQSRFAGSSGQVSSITSATSPGARFSFNYHRGGSAYLSAIFSAQNLATNSKSFFVGTTVTLRDFTHRAVSK
jgi:hypothetical protein